MAISHRNRRTNSLFFTGTACLILAAACRVASSAVMTSTSVGVSYNGAYSGVPSDIDSTSTSAQIYSHVQYDSYTGTPLDIEGHAEGVSISNSYLGAEAWATDGIEDKFTVRGYVSARSNLSLLVTDPGTLIYGLYYSGSLEVTLRGFGEEAGANFSSVVIRRPCAGCGNQTVGGEIAGSAEIKGFQFWDPYLTLSTSGALDGSVLNGNRANLSASANMVVDLPYTGLYQLVMALDTYAGSGDSRSGAEVATSSDSLHSFGFGGNFWDVVEGTASFSDYDNPSNSYAPGLPAPPTAWLSAPALLAGLLIRKKRSEKKRASAG